MLKTSEIYVEGAFVEGPELPEPTYSHCMIRLNETHSLLTGGWNTVSNTLFFAK